MSININIYIYRECNDNAMGILTIHGINGWFSLGQSLLPGAMVKKLNENMGFIGHKHIK
jgi:hypothetical protein